MLKRNGNVLINTDNDAYQIAKRRRAMEKAKEERDAKIDVLFERVDELEKIVFELKKVLLPEAIWF